MSLEEFCADETRISKRYDLYAVINHLDAGHCELIFFVCSLQADIVMSSILLKLLFTNMQTK